jgi:allophanate hydrolase subunit 2
MTLVAARVTGLVTIQDLGRPGRMHEALPPAGALVPELLVAANRAARNPDHAPALEVFGQLVVRTERDEQVIAVDGEPRILRAGEELVVTSEPRRVAYLAARGGFAAPLVLGGRATQLSAGIGASIRTGAQLALATEPDIARALEPFDDTPPVRVVPGPDLDAFAPDAFDRFVATPYRISPRSDRVGTRLEGRAIQRRADRAERSRPMVRGAIEVPGDGMPIILGPEHPTTGGYPILAVIAHADLGRCFAIRIGGMLALTRR